ncbi:SDR family oxidoreductase [Pseudomonadales bacterium]|nr:SDR family oxidoreductase [Pseudomonadales bacterium]
MTDQTKYPSLKNRTVFITGGATGIGAAMVRAFSEQGAKVAFVDLAGNAAHDLLTNIEQSTGMRPWFRQLDITDIAALQSAIHDAAAELGPLRTLVNNAANDMRHAPADVTPDSWRNTMAINLDATFFAAQTAAELMTKQDNEQGGSIINFSSINALLGPTNMPGYVAAKAGIMGLTKSLAKDFGGANIRVNAILPGWVVTQKQLDTWLTPEAERAWMEQVALQKRLQPADVANLALFLAADDSAMITGQSLTIDGGRT